MPYSGKFDGNIDIQRICSLLSVSYSKPIIAGKTLLFFDEIQACPNAINALRYFYEDFPELHLIAAGSLLEFALAELPSFGVGRIQSLFMYPLSFNEFVGALKNPFVLDYLQKHTTFEPIEPAVHSILVDYWRTFMLIGGMPETVSKWVAEKDYILCQQVNDNILTAYTDDFSKYKHRVSPVLLQKTLQSVALQSGSKFMYNRVVDGIDSYKVREALELLMMAGLIIPVTHSAGNGVPLGAETNEKFHKYLFLDNGLMLVALHANLAEFVLSDNTQIVCKGALAEVIAGLEIIKYMSPTSKHSLFYWQNFSKGTQSEVDYLIERNGQVIPIEVKAGTRGSMKSMYYFLQIKNLPYGIRTSLENFGELERVKILPLYALQKMLG